MILSQGFSVTFAPLSALQGGEQGTFYKLRGTATGDAHLHSMGLTLGTPITLICRSPQLIIQVRGHQIPISAELAQRISVRLEPTCPVTLSPEIPSPGIRIRFPRLRRWLAPLLIQKI